MLDETELPPIEAFYDDLNEQPCSASNYAHVTKMWEVFGMTSMKDLLELYVKLNVLQLYAVFQRYRKEALSAYGLDPLHFYTAPGLSKHHFYCSPKSSQIDITINSYIIISLLHSLIGLTWEADLKFTKAGSDLITDADLHLFVERTVCLVGSQQ